MVTLSILNVGSFIHISATELYLSRVLCPVGHLCRGRRPGICRRTQGPGPSGESAPPVTRDDYAHGHRHTQGNPQRWAHLVLADDGTKVRNPKLGRPGLGWGPTTYDKCPYQRQKRRDTQAHREKGGGHGGTPEPPGATGKVLPEPREAAHVPKGAAPGSGPGPSTASAT